MDVIKCIHPGQETDYSSIPLSRVSTQRQVCDIAQQLKLSLQAKFDEEKSLFALAIDESMDINNSAQLLIFVRCLSSSFELSEDFLSTETLALMEKTYLLLLKMRAFAPNLIKKIFVASAPMEHLQSQVINQLGFVIKFSDFLSNEYSSNRLINLHCMTYQEALRAKSVALNAILKGGNCIIPLIHSRKCSSSLAISRNFILV